MTSQTGKKVVLVVDDDIEVRQFIVAALGSEGCEVHEATNGQEALDCISKNKPNFYDLILLDMQMPVMDGWKFLPVYRQYQQEEENALKAPVIVMTAALTLARYASQIKAEGYLTKPFNLNDLLLLVDKHLLKRREGYR